jgi:hypothetical protein
MMKSFGNSASPVQIIPYSGVQTEKCAFVKQWLIFKLFSVLNIYTIKKSKMKKVIKISSYILATIMVLLVSQGSVFAANDASNKGSLSGGQVFGGFALLVLVILLPLIKGAKKREMI